MFKNILIFLLSVISILLASYTLFMQRNGVDVVEKKESLEKTAVIDTVFVIEKTADSSFLFQDTMSICDTVLDQPNRKQRVIVHTYHSNGMAALARVTHAGRENLIYYDSNGFVTASRWNEHSTQSVLWLCVKAEVVDKTDVFFGIFKKAGPDRIYDIVRFANNFKLTKSPFACEY